MNTSSTSSVLSGFKLSVIALVLWAVGDVWAANLPSLGNVAARQSGVGLTGMLPMPTNSPVALFRALLRVSVSEQRQMLSTRSEAKSPSMEPIIVGSAMYVSRCRTQPD